MDTELARQAIRAVGHVAVRVPTIAAVALDKLLTFIDLGIDYVTATTLVVCKGIPSARNRIPGTLQVTVLVLVFLVVSAELWP
jgi:hypothetical protein